MGTISSNQDFSKALASLPLKQQRRVGAQFVMNVLDLTDGSCDPDIKALAESPEMSDEDLEASHHQVNQYFSSTHLRPYAQLDYRLQGAHFVATACVACFAPAYGKHKANHLAELVAGYCRMARTCAAIPHEEEEPSLKGAEDTLAAEIKAQFDILNAFLAEHD